MIFQSWLIQSIDEIDQLYDRPLLVKGTFQRAAAIAYEAGNKAAREGFAELHRQSLTFSGMADPPAVKTFLASCLAVCPINSESAALLSVDDVSNIIQASPASIYRLADGGRMPKALKVGGLVRWSRIEIDNWIATGCKRVK